MSNSRKFVHLVVQRFRSARLLLEEARWVSVPPAAPDEIPSSSSDSNQQQQHVGLLLYVSFAAGADRSSVYDAAESCLNLPVLTTGLWGDGVSEQPSLRELLEHPEQYSETSTSIIVVPQANLISKVKSQGKSIQYHGQIQKIDGELLYDYFCDCIRAAVYEVQCGTDCLPDWFISWKAQRLDRKSSTKNDNQQHPSALDPSLPPEQVFRSDPKYGSFDSETGMPLSTADGEPLTKSASKKLRKLYDAHDKRHTKWKETNDSDDNCETSKVVAVESEVPSSEPRADNVDVSTVDWDTVLHSPVVAGSFGMRQGLEIKSDMGPFCHVFQV